MQPPTGKESGSERPNINWSQPLKKKPPGAGQGGHRWAGYGPASPQASEEQEPLLEAQRYGSAQEARRAAFGFPNVGQQFRTNPEVQRHAKRLFDANEKANYFYHAGLGAALRHSLGIPQDISHLQHYMQRTRSAFPRNPGLNPQPLFAVRNEPEA